MEILLWAIVFLICLFVVVKGADWLLGSAERIGLAMGLSPFVVGVTIVGLGTSFPELVSSIVAALKGAPEIVPANAIGSNVANILLIVGLAAVVGRRLVVTKSLIDLDLPLLAIGTVLLLGVVWDREVTYIEALILLISYGIYFLYSLLQRKEEKDVREPTDIFPNWIERKKHVVPNKKKEKVGRPKIKAKDIILLIVGIIFLVLGAQWLIESVINLSQLLNIATGVIAITAVAFGTSLPELMVSVKAAFKNKPEVALGNIFGSNVFNGLVVIGLPAVFRSISLDEKTFTIGVPAMIVATFLFIISGISKRIHAWEGVFYLAVYVMFVGKLFNLF